MSWSGETGVSAVSEFHLISSDSHVTMPDEAWQTYLVPEFRDRAPVIEQTDEGVFRVFEGTGRPSTR